MKHSLSGLLMALILIAQPAVAVAVAGGPTLAIQLPASSNTTVNGQFVVYVQMDTKTYQVSAAELHLTYPADKLQALAVTKGTFLPNELTPGSVGAGTASITVGSGTQAVQGTGSIAAVTFRALAPGTAVIGFEGTTAVAAVGSAGNVVDAMTAGTVTIGAATVATTAPTPLASSVVVSVGHAGQVTTGPLETTVLALIVGSIITLLYVGYVGGDSFRRSEAAGIAKEEHDRTPDFLDR